MRNLWTIVAIALLAGCATKTQTADIVSAEAALTAAGKLVVNYEALPPCGTAGVTLCSSPTVKQEAKQAFDAAYTAVTTAQQQADAGQTVDMNAVNTTVTALQNIVQMLQPSKGN